MRPTRARLWWLGALLAATMFAAQALATSAIAPLTIEELTKSSELVLRGRVAGMRTTMEGNQIFTYIEVRVEEAYKGSLGKQTIAVRLLGGEANGLRMRVLGGPCLTQEEEVVLFTRKDGAGYLTIVSLAEGKFSVQRSARGPIVTRDLSGIQFAQQQPVPAPRTLAELKAAVSAAR